MAGDAITTKFKVDISDLKKGITEANKNIKLANAQFKAASSGMDNWRKSSDGIKAKLSQLQSVLNSQVTKLKSYKDQLKETEKAASENGKRATELKAKLQELADAGVSKTSEEYKKYEKALTEVEKEQLANQKSAESLRTTILNQQGSVDGIVREMRNWKSALNNVQDEQKQAESATGKLTSEMSEQQAELDRLKRKYKDVALAEGETSDEARQLASQIRTLSGDLSSNQQKMNALDSAADRLDDSLDDLDDGARTSSDGFTVMKGALANLVADGIRNAINKCKELATEIVNVGASFDIAMSQVQAVSGASGDEIDALRQKAKDMGSTTKFTATEAADAFNYMAMAGWKTEDMMSGIDGILNLAAAAGSDLATTSDIVTDALTAMGYKAGDAGRLADVMAAASSNANTNVEMMGLTFQYAAPLVGALGYTMEDTAVAIGLMANAGIKGEKAGTALRSIFTRLAAPPKECANAMEELGISLTDTNGKMKPFSKVIEELREKMSTLSETEQAGTAKHIAGQEAMSGLLAIVNAAPADFKKLTKAVDQSAGSASKMSETMLDNVGGDFTILKSQFEGIQIQIYEKLVPALRKGMEKISKALSSVNWDKFGKSAGDALAKVVSWFTWILNNGGTVTTVIKLLLEAFVVSKLISFTSSLSTMVTTVISLATATTTATGATTAATVATNLFNAAWRANPIGVVLTAVGLLVAGIIALTSATKDNVDAAQVRNEKAQEQLKAINDEAKAYDNLRQSQIEQAEKDLAGIANVQRLKDELTNLASETGKVKEKDKERANFILNELNTALGTEYKMTGNQIQNYKNMQTEISKTIELKRAEILLKSQEGMYTEAVTKYTEAQSKSAKMAQEIVKQEENVKKKQAEVAAAQAKATSMVGTKREAEYTRHAIRLGEELAKEENTLNKKKSAYNKNEQTLHKYYSDINDYEKASSLIMEGKTKKAVKLLENKNNAFKTAKDVANKSAKDQKKILEQQVIDTEVNARLMKERYKSGVEGVTKEMVNTAEKQADKAKTEFYNVGGNITKGISKGAKDNEWHLSKTMTNIIDGAVKVAKKAGIIKSPSRLFAREVGQWISKGIAKGVTDNKNSVSKAVVGLVNSSVSEAKSTFQNSGFDKVGTNVLNSATKSINSFVTTSTNSVKSLINDSVDSYSKGIDKKIKKINKNVDKQVAAIKADKKLSSAQKTKRINKIKDGAKEEIAELKKNKEAYKAAGKASITAYTDALKDYASAAKEAVSAAMDKVNAEFQAKYDALIQKQTALQDKFKNFGDLFTLNENGTMTINDITKQTEAINKYAADLQKIKGKVSAELFDEIANMSMEDGQKYVSKLLAMNDKDLKEYNAAYTQKLQAAKSLSENIFKKDLQDLNTQYNKAVDIALSGVATNLETIGKQAMSGFIKGMKSQKSSMAKEIKGIADDIIKQFKKSLKIKSPSRVFANEVGKFIPSGIAVGIQDNAKALIKSVKKVTNQAVGLSQEMLSGMSVPRLATAGAGIEGGSTTNVVNNFTQNINAPKQPSRIELYRQTKNLLSWKGGA